MRRFILLFVTLALASAAAVVAHAADEISDSNQSELSTQTESFFGKLEPPSAVKEEDPVIILEKEKDAPQAPREASFFVGDIILDGNTLFSRAELDKYIRGYEYKDATFDELKELAQIITNHYRSKGFISSYAYLPPQQVTRHSVTIKIMEGKIGNILVEGNTLYSTQSYQEAIMTRPDKILNFMDIERSLKTINQDPAKKVKAYLIQSGTPGIMDIKLKAEEIQVPAAAAPTPTPEAPAISTERPVIIVEQDAQELGAVKEPLFYLREIKIEDNTIFTKKDLSKYISNYENRTTSFLELKELSQLITNQYRANNYLTSRAYLPPQKIENESITIKIIEGKIGNVFVEGNRYFDSKIYQQAVVVQKDRIFRYSDLERSLYFLNQKPDRKVKAYLIAGSEPSFSDIILKAQETNPIHASYEFSNRGSKLTHRARHGFRFAHNNFSGHDDTLNVGFTLAQEAAIKAWSLSHSFPIDKRGTLWSLDTSYVNSMLIGHLKPFEVKGKSFYLSPKVTYPFIKTPTVSLDGTLGFEYKNSATLINDVQANADRMRVITIGPSLTVQGISGRTILGSQANFGIPNIMDGLDSVDERSTKTNAGGEFAYYTASVARIQRLPEFFYLILRTNGQWTRDTLASSEQYRAGGAYTVRGYPEGDSSGDYGFNMTAELSAPAHFVPAEWKVPFIKKKWRDSVRFIGFIDGGRTFIRERVSDTDVKSRFLLGAGFGIRVDLDKTFSLQLDLGFPMGDKSMDEDQKQVHFSMRGGF